MFNKCSGFDGCILHLQLATREKRIRHYTTPIEIAIAAAAIALDNMATDGPSSVIMSSGGGSAVEPKEETHHYDSLLC